MIGFLNKRLKISLLALVCATASFATEGATCDSAVVVDANTQSIVVNTAGEHWYKISVDRLPMAVFYPTSVSTNAPTAEFDFRCPGTTYTDKTLEAAVRLLEQENGIQLPFSLAFQYTTVNNVDGYSLTISNKYKTYLMSLGITYEVFAYVKLTIPEEIIDTTRTDTIPLITPARDCLEESTSLLMGGTIAINANDSDRSIAFPLSTWKKDTVILSWEGSSPLTIFMGATDCEFNAKYNDPNLLDYITIPAGGKDTITREEMNDPNELGIGEILYVKCISQSAGQLSASRPDHSVVVDRDGLTKQTAFEFDWNNLNNQPIGSYWYHLNLDTLYEYDYPTLILHVVNDSTTAGTFTFSAEYNGQTESRTYNLNAGQDWSRTENVSAITRMNQHEIYFQLRGNVPLVAYAQLYENTVETDDACLNATIFDWDNGNTQAANSEKWYAIDLREIMRQSVRQDLVVSVKNLSNATNNVKAIISLTCPAVPQDSLLRTLSPNDSLTRTINAGTIRALADSLVYVRLTNQGQVHISAHAVVSSSQPLWTAVKPLRILVGGEYYYPYSTITVTGNQRDTANIGDKVYYWMKRKDLVESKMQAVVTVTNLGTGTAHLHGDLSFERTCYANDKSRSLTLAAGETTTYVVDKSQLTTIGADSIFMRVYGDQPFFFSIQLESTKTGTACSSARVFEWGRDNVLKTNTPGTIVSQWYAIPLIDARTAMKDIYVRITNRTSNPANMSGAVAFECPYSDLQEIPERTIAANDTLSKTVKLSTYYMISADTVYVNVLTDQSITLYAEFRDREVVEVETGCLNSILFDWEFGNRDTLSATKDTTWLKVGLNDSIRNTSLIPVVYVTNHNTTSSLRLDGTLFLSCPDSIGGQSRSLTIAAGEIYTYEISRDLMKRLDPAIDTVYIRIIAQTSNVIDYSYKVEFIQPDLGSQCNVAINFNWISGHDQAAGTELWYRVDLTNVKSSGKDVIGTIANRTADACAVTVAYYPDCATEQPQVQSMNLSANGIKQNTISNSSFESLPDVIYLKISACTDIHFEAQLVEPEPFDTIYCNDLIDFKFDSLFTYPGGNDTIFYLIDAADLDTLRNNPALSIRAMVADSNNCGTQTVTGMVYYRCPITSQPMTKSASLKDGQTIYKLLERAAIENVISAHDTIIVMITAPYCFSFKGEIVDPNSGQDCEHAVRSGVDCFVHDAGSKWYRYDIDELISLQSMLDISALNLSSTTTDTITVTAYTECGGDRLISRTTTIKADSTLAQQLSADLLMGVGGKHIFLNISTTQPTKICLDTTAYPTIDTIRITEFTEVIPNIAIDSVQPDSTWYFLDVEALLADQCWDSVTITAYNRDVRAVNVHGELTWDSIVTHAMTERDIKLAVGDSITRTFARNQLESMRSKTPYVRITANGLVGFLVSAELCKYENTCQDPIEYNWKTGITHQSEEDLWYHVYVDPDTLAAHAGDELQLTITNLTATSTLSRTTVYDNCQAPYIFIYNTTIDANSSKTKSVSSCVIETFTRNGYDFYILYHSLQTTRVKAVWIHRDDEVENWYLDSIPNNLTWHDTIAIDTFGTYFDTLRYITQPNCDSIHYVLNVIQHTYVVTEQSDTICYGDTIFFGTDTLLQSGIYRDTFFLALDKDSISVMNLLVQAPLQEQYDTLYRCYGDTALWHGLELHTSCDTAYHTYYTTGCDSLTYRLHLTIAGSAPLDSTFTDSICGNGTEPVYYTWRTRPDKTDTLPGSTLTKTYDLYDTIYSATGCDSIRYYTTVTVLQTTIISQADTVCLVDLPSYEWLTPGTATPAHYQFDPVSKEYTDAAPFANVPNCDSVIYTLRLTVQSPLIDTLKLDTTLCYGESIDWYDNTYAVAGEYHHVLYYQNSGCDSQYCKLTLRIREQAQIIDDNEVSMCEGSNIAWRGKTITEGGIYADTIKYANSTCDSIIYRVNVNVLTTTIDSIEATFCQGGNYVWEIGDRTRIFTQPGRYTETFRYASDLCDSVIHILKLTQLEPINAPAENIHICYGESLQWKDGNTYSTSGRRTYLYHSDVTGCDSILYTLNLTVGTQMTILPAETLYICAQGGSEVWSLNGMTYSAAGHYYDTLQNVYGCDSIAGELFVEINTPTMADPESASIFDTQTYTWRGDTYTTAGTYYDTTYYVNGGCIDTIYTLILTVEPIVQESAFINDIVCSGTIYTTRFSTMQYIISQDTTLTDHDIVLNAQGALVDSLYTYNIKVYRLALPDMAMDSVIVVCGVPINVANANLVIEDYASDPANQPFAPDVQVSWYILIGTTWTPLTPSVILDGQTTSVTLRCDLNTSCGSTSQQRTYNVQPTGATTYTEYDYLPALSLYGNTMLMVDLNTLQTSLGWTIQESDVEWYRVNGEMDNLSDPGAVHNDVLVGYGYYYTSTTPLSGAYYAVIRKAIVLPSDCDAWARTVLIDCSGTGIFLQPNPTQAGSTVAIITPSNASASYSIEVATLSGTTILKTTGTEFPAPSAGTYIVTLNSIYHFTLMVY